jgi:uncharacterized protein (TIGR02001 family)
MEDGMGVAKLAIGLLLLPAGAAHAQEVKDALFPTITVASEYRFDGASNSSGEPVVQGSLYWWRPDHFYAGVFLTTVDYYGFYDPDTSYEIDLYGGYNWDFGAPYFEMGGDATRVTAEVMATFFPDQGPPGPTYDFVQAKLQIQHRTGPLTLRAEAGFTPEAAYNGGPSWKSEIGGKYAVADWLTLGGEYGYREMDHSADRSWWDIGATASFGQVDFDLRYYDTDLDFVECGFSRNCSSALVGSISWNPWKG